MAPPICKVIGCSCLILELSIFIIFNKATPCYFSCRTNHLFIFYLVLFWNTYEYAVGSKRRLYTGLCFCLLLCFRLSYMIIGWSREGLCNLMKGMWIPIHVYSLELTHLRDLFCQVHIIFVMQNFFNLYLKFELSIKYTFLRWRGLQSADLEYQVWWTSLRG